MCTAVVGGSIQRAATRISTANAHRSASPMRTHRTKNRREGLRGGGVGCASEFSGTLQNNRFGGIDIVPDRLPTRTNVGNVRLALVLSASPAAPLFSIYVRN